MIYNKTKTNTEKGTDRHNDATIIYFFHKITNRIDLHFTIPQEERLIGVGVGVGVGVGEGLNHVTGKTHKSY